MVRQPAPGDRHAPSPGATGMAALRRWFTPLPAPMRAAFDGQVDAGIAQLLPVLGPVCGAFVMLFAAWDAWIDPANAGVTLRIRAGLILLGSLAYAEGRLRWTPGWRCA